MNLKFIIFIHLLLFIDITLSETNERNKRLVIHKRTNSENYENNFRRNQQINLDEEHLERKRRNTDVKNSQKGNKNFRKTPRSTNHDRDVEQSIFEIFGSDNQKQTKNQTIFELTPKKQTLEQEIDEIFGKTLQKNTDDSTTRLVQQTDEAILDIFGINPQQSTDHLPIDQLTKNQPTKDKPTKDQPIKDQSSKDQPIDEIIDEIFGIKPQQTTNQIIDEIFNENSEANSQPDSDRSTDSIIPDVIKKEPHVNQDSIDQSQHQKPDQDDSKPTVEELLKNPDAIYFSYQVNHILQPKNDTTDVVDRNHGTRPSNQKNPVKNSESQISSQTQTGNQIERYGNQIQNQLDQIFGNSNPGNQFQNQLNSILSNQNQLSNNGGQIINLENQFLNYLNQVQNQGSQIPSYQIPYVETQMQNFLNQLQYYGQDSGLGNQGTVFLNQRYPIINTGNPITQFGGTNPDISNPVFGHINSNIGNQNSQFGNQGVNFGNPHQGNSRPHHGGQGPHHGSQRPHHGNQGPHHGNQGPHYGNSRPNHGSQGLQHGSQGSHHGSQGSYHGNQGPHHGSQGSHHGNQRPNQMNNRPVLNNFGSSDSFGTFIPNQNNQFLNFGNHRPILSGSVPNLGGSVPNHGGQIYNLGNLMGNLLPNQGNQNFLDNVRPLGVNSNNDNQFNQFLNQFLGQKPNPPTDTGSLNNQDDLPNISGEGIIEPRFASNKKREKRATFGNRGYRISGNPGRNQYFYSYGDNGGFDGPNSFGPNYGGGSIEYFGNPGSFSSSTSGQGFYTEFNQGPSSFKPQGNFGNYQSNGDGSYQFYFSGNGNEFNQAYKPSFGSNQGYANGFGYESGGFPNSGTSTGNLLYKPSITTSPIISTFQPSFSGTSSIIPNKPTSPSHASILDELFEENSSEENTDSVNINLNTPMYGKPENNRHKTEKENSSDTITQVLEDLFPDEKSATN